MDFFEGVITYQPLNKGGMLVHFTLPLTTAREQGWDQAPVYLTLTTACESGIRLSKTSERKSQIAEVDKLAVFDEMLRITFHLNHRQFRKLKCRTRGLVPDHLGLTRNGMAIRRMGLYFFVGEILDRECFLVILHYPDFVIDPSVDTLDFFNPVIVNGVWQNDRQKPLYVDRNLIPTDSRPSIEYVQLKHKKIKSKTNQFAVFETTEASWERLKRWGEERSARESLESN